MEYTCKKYMKHEHCSMLPRVYQDWAPTETISAVWGPRIPLEKTIPGKLWRSFGFLFFSLCVTLELCEKLSLVHFEYYAK